MLVMTTQCFAPRRGGIEHLMHALAECLAQNGLPVQVLADASRDAQSVAFDRAQPFATRRFAGPKPWRRWRKAHTLARLLADPQCRGVIADSWKSLECLRLDKMTGKPPIICLAHGTEVPSSPVQNAKTRRITAAYAKATFVVANSHATAQRVAPWLADPAQLRVIHPGLVAPAAVSPARSQEVELALANRTPRLISVGRLEARKGVDTVLRILPRLIAQFPTLMYSIIGDGSQRAALAASVAANALTHHVHLISDASNATRNAYLAASDLFVLPGRSLGDDVEGFGIAFIEAAWFGLPAVAGIAGGAAEAVIDNKTGLTCRGDDDEAVYTAIVRLLNDAAWRQRLGVAAQARAQEFLWSHVLARYLPLFAPPR